MEIFGSFFPITLHNALDHEPPRMPFPGSQLHAEECQLARRAPRPGLVRVKQVAASSVQPRKVPQLKPGNYDEVGPRMCMCDAAAARSADGPMDRLRGLCGRSAAALRELCGRSANQNVYGHTGLKLVWPETDPERTRGNGRFPPDPGSSNKSPLGHHSTMTAALRPEMLNRSSERSQLRRPSDVVNPQEQGKDEESEDRRKGEGEEMAQERRGGESSGERK